MKKVGKENGRKRKIKKKKMGGRLCVSKGRERI